MPCQFCGHLNPEVQAVCYECAKERTVVRWLYQRVLTLEAAIAFVLADAESQHPGGWGPDVTMVGVLKRALDRKAE